MGHREKVRPAILEHIEVYGIITVAETQELMRQLVKDCGPSRVRWVLAGMAGGRKPLIRRIARDTYALP